MFFCDFCKKKFKTAFFIEHLQLLLECQNLQSTNERSSHFEVFFKNSVLKDFAKFTWKHLCQDLFFNKVAGLSSSTLDYSIKDNINRRTSKLVSFKFMEWLQPLT